MFKTSVCLAFLVCCSLAAGQHQQQQQQKRATVEQPQVGNFPAYMQSPIFPQTEQPIYVQAQDNPLKPIAPRASTARMVNAAQPMQPVQLAPPSQPNLTVEQQQQQQQQQQHQQKQTGQCLYDKRYFSRFDECLTRRPYATIGLPAFKNEDLLVKQGRNKLKSDNKRGCSFILSNGLFKNYLISSFSLDSDTQCLETNGKLSMSLEFPNATLYYLWQLRCLNYADQMLDDSTANGRLAESLEADLEAANSSDKEQDRPAQLCAGSSQTFGFTLLQLTNIEAQIELVADVYKNWRVTNVSLALAPSKTASQQETLSEPPSSIKEFAFESLDGDELNWRYLQMYSNWSRNRLHTNFLEQFRRFLWISLQRCLGEYSEKLPVKLVDIFGNHKYT